jgi:hypothetical protein
MNHKNEQNFNEKYGELFDGFRKFSLPILNYNMMFIARRVLFILMVYYLSGPEWTIA